MQPQCAAIGRRCFVFRHFLGDLLRRNPFFSRAKASSPVYPSWPATPLFIFVVLRVLDCTRREIRLALDVIQFDLLRDFS